VKQSNVVYSCLYQAAYCIIYKPSYLAPLTSCSAGGGNINWDFILASQSIEYLAQILFLRAFHNAKEYSYGIFLLLKITAILF
jgi:hypothetical protein